MVTINRNICVAPVPGVEGVYGYDPSLGWGVVFSVLFGLSMASHLFSTVRNRRWWQVTFAIGALRGSYWTTCKTSIDIFL